MTSNSIIAVDILPHNDGKVVMYGAPNKDITHLVSELEIIKLEQILHEKNSLPRGVTDLDYEFRVPGNLPQTYRTNFGAMFYKLVAVVQPASLMSKYTRVEKGINFLRHYLPCRREFLPAPPQKIYKGERKDIINFELELPTIICVNEKSLLIRLRRCPKSDQVSIVPLNGLPLKKRKRIYPIAPTTFNVSNEVDNWNNALIYDLPFAQYSQATRKSRLKATLKSPLMKVRHKFRFVLMFEDENENDLELNSLLAELFGVINLPSYDDTFMEISPITHSEITNVDNERNNESGVNEPMLENNSHTKDSGTSTSDPPSVSSSRRELLFEESPDTSLASIEQVNASYYLNMPDEDDLDGSSAFVIRSEPNSPKLSGIPGTFAALNDLSSNVENNNHNLSLSNVFHGKSFCSKAISKSHRRSVSLDSSVVVESSSTLNGIGSSKTHYL
ncbi:8427_t:CDS:2 [Racocetra fulgida]|uniref:8427_t:CDS:1 n=1 Tax=Racocetra fulgida TaxID=60492 RepID=A0A9N9CQH5_9GLOM|nr:8427_t:CDS:2 [Racocetra fulgida]